MIETVLDRCLPKPIRAQIEQAYYGRVNEQSRFEQLILDPDFWITPPSHPGLFSDHGIVHVQDVAKQTLQVLKTIHGLLIPPRDPGRIEGFMYGYGVIVAYLHDIGMSDLSPFGRAMHPEFAAQAVFNGELDNVIDAVWAENCGNVAGRLVNLTDQGILKRDPKIIFRELLSLSVCHSKSKIPVVVLDDPVKLRSKMQFILSHYLADLYLQQQAAKGMPAQTTELDKQPPKFLSRYYLDIESEAFDWLVDESDKARDLVSDVTDTLRALRCADALRQRGTVQKTSGGYEVFLSQRTGNPVYALRLGDDKLYLLEYPDPNSAGEANIASSEFTNEGNLEISFHRGAYDNDEALRRAVYSTAFIINDILSDIVDSFWREKKAGSEPRKGSNDILILLESTDDHPRFVELVEDQLIQFTPSLRSQVQIVPSLQHTAELERDRYLMAQELNWDVKQRQAVQERMARSGQKITGDHLVEGFRHVKLINIKAGETLIEAGSPASFVYIPLGNGLKIIPLGGYQSFSVSAWMPVGNTGVIRGAIRNADVVAEQDISLLMIPKEVYLRYWYLPYTTAELKSILGNEAA